MCLNCAFFPRFFIESVQKNELEDGNAAGAALIHLNLRMTNQIEMQPNPYLAENREESFEGNSKQRGAQWDFSHSVGEVWMWLQTGLYNGFGLLLRLPGKVFFLPGSLHPIITDLQTRYTHSH